MRPISRRTSRRGFTLIEAALVTVIVGLAGVATLTLLAAGTVSNTAGTEMTTAINLANNIHEMSLSLAFADPTTPTHWGAESNETSVAAYDDTDDLAGRSFSPPLDARRQQISGLYNWAQNVTVQTVDPNNVTLALPNGSTPMERVTVTVTHNGRTVYTTSWLTVDASMN